MSIPAPINEYTRCRRCGRENARHYSSRDIHDFQPPNDLPEEHERVPAMAITEWTCRACGREQDVWGEGAIYEWMDCQFVDCSVASHLDFDLGISDALGTTVPKQQRTEATS